MERSLFFRYFPNQVTGIIKFLKQYCLIDSYIGNGCLIQSYLMYYNFQHYQYQFTEVIINCQSVYNSLLKVDRRMRCFILDASWSNIFKLMNAHQYKCDYLETCLFNK